ncbi:MAG TPA: response regulator transcription factor, partial [Actinomycetota bacterium]|nr:response regulator transcription factor [Actinomycetota bacterium]
MARVLVVEDDPTMAEMVAYNLRRQGLEVEIAHDGSLGLERGKAAEVSLILLDVMLPSVDGLQIAHQLRAARPGLPILMLTARGEEEIKLRGFAAGADDYLTKPFSMEELMVRVKALVRRSRAEAIRTESPSEIIFGDLHLVARDFRCWVAGREVALRPKEFSLLARLCSEPGRLFSRVELAEDVWGYNHLGDTRTIDTHVKNVRRKVETGSAYRYIETVRGLGYRFRLSPKSSEGSGAAA